MSIVSQELAWQVGITCGPDGLPSKRDLASHVRMLLRLRGPVPSAEIVEWLVSICCALGYARDACSERVRAVLTDMASAREVGFIRCGSEEAVVGQRTRLIAVSGKFAAAVGVDEAATSYESPFGERADLTIRHILVVAGAVDLGSELGRPTYRDALAALGLNYRFMPTLAAFPGFIADLLHRIGVVPDEGEVRVIGGCGTGNGIAYGYVTRGGIDAPHAILRRDGDFRVLRLPNNEALGWLALALFPGFLSSDTVELPASVAPPSQLLAALHMSGISEHGDCRRWKLLDGAGSILRTWLGLSEPEENVQLSPDPAQLRVIEADVSRRMVVDAGPGSGKTWVACRRVAHLIEQGAAASRIWLISFTRAAVGELRDRIAGFLSEPDAALEIRILTLDSFSWRLRNGFSEEEGESLPGGYDANITEAMALVSGGDSAIAEFLGGVEHLILDEAQDLTGDRRKLSFAIVSALDDSCGVTVFADSAQAIYAYSEEPGTTDLPLKDMLLSARKLEFNEVRLDRDYRTRTAILKSLFADARYVLIGKDQPSGRQRYDRVRALIKAAAGEVLPPLNDQDFATSGSMLMLFRSRAEMFGAAADLWRNRVLFDVRFAGREPAVVSWVGAVLSRAAGDSLNRAAFDAAWDELWPPPAATGRDAAWGALLRFARGGRNTIDLRMASERLSSFQPPLELTTQAGVRRKLVLSTIHGAKGREADNVRLMLPPVPDDECDVDWDEEARVLFVGATRARRSLHIGKGRARLKDDGQTSRLWQACTFRSGRNALVEVGVDGDVDIAMQGDPGSWGGPEGLKASQEKLWALGAGERPVPLVAVREGRNHFFVLHVEGEDPEMGKVGFLSGDILSDLWMIGKKVHGERLVAPPHRIEGINLIDVRTVAFCPSGSAADPGSESRRPFLLVPIVAGLSATFFHTEK